MDYEGLGLCASESQVSREAAVVPLEDDAALDMESGAVAHSAVFTTVSFSLITQMLPSALNAHFSGRNAPQEP